MWNVYERTLNDLPNTNNSIEEFHNALQNSVTNTHPNWYMEITGNHNSKNMKGVWQRRKELPQTRRSSLHEEEYTDVIYKYKALVLCTIPSVSFTIYEVLQ